MSTDFYIVPGKVADPTFEPGNCDTNLVVVVTHLQ